MIRGFKDREALKVFMRTGSRRLPPDVQRIGRRKLVMLNAAERLDDLRAPPGNRLEAMAGDRKGKHSIRINNRWRVCFTWTDEGPDDVEIVDYH